MVRLLDSWRFSLSASPIPENPLPAPSARVRMTPDLEAHQRGAAAARARGVQLGGNRGAIIGADARETSRKARLAASETRAADLAPVDRPELPAAGVASL